MRRIVTALILAIGLLVAPAPAAQAQSWASWGAQTKGTKARFSVGYGTIQRGGKVQFARKRASRGKVKVAMRWRYVDGSLNPVSSWNMSTKWKRIAPGKRLVLRGPRQACHPQISEIQAVAKVRTKGKWRGPKVLKVTTGSSLSAC